MGIHERFIQCRSHKSREFNFLVTLTKRKRVSIGSMLTAPYAKKLPVVYLMLRGILTRIIVHKSFEGKVSEEYRIRYATNENR